MKIWFQNRRTKWKKVENISNAEAARIMKSKLGKGPPEAEEVRGGLDPLKLCSK